MEGTPTKSATPRHYIGTLSAVLGWGLSTTFVEFGLAFIEPFLFLALRFSLAILIVSPFILVTRRSEVIKLFKTRWVYMIAFCETSGLLFQYIGQEQIYHVSAGLASLLTMMFIIIVPALSYWLLHEKFYTSHALAIILGFIGVFFIVTQGNLSNLANSSTTGVILLLLSATAYAFYQISTSKFTRDVDTNVDTFSLFYVVMILIASFSFVVSFIHSKFVVSFDVSLNAWFWIFNLAIFSTIFAFVGYFEASKGIPANTLSILLISQMLVPFFIDITILGYNYSLWVYTGGLIIIIGMFFIARVPTEQQAPLLQNEVPS